MSITYPNPEQFHLKLDDFYTKKLPGYIEILKEMVKTNSFTSNFVGVNELAKFTSQQFAKLGFNSQKIMSSNPLHGDHLILRKGSDRKRSIGTIVFVSHLDTVYPADEEKRNDFGWRPQGDIIYGPGTVDIKGGTLIIFMVLESLMTLAPELFERTTWYVLLNAAEEELVPEFKQVCLDALPERVDACLVFEGGRSRDRKFSLVTSRKGMITYRIEVSGRAAHAGSAHKNGANSVVQLAETISKIARLTDYEKELTFNVATMDGGTVLNRVPHLAAATGEARAYLPAVLDQGMNALLALKDAETVRSVSDDYPCKVEIEILGKWQPWPGNKGSNRLFSVWKESANVMGYDAVEEKRGGLSDGNWLWETAPTLDGLGPSGGNAHCSERSSDGSKDQEFVRVSSFIPKATLNVLGIINLLREKEESGQTN